jgi:hypothetical protein
MGKLPMNNHLAERSLIRTRCRDLRKSILSARPANMLALLLELGDVECSASNARPDEFPAIRENLLQLANRLRRSANGMADPEQKSCRIPG